MPRIIYINGETMATVVGPAGSAIAGAAQLGLSVNPIPVELNIEEDDIIVDAYGKGNPVDVQVFGGTAIIRMQLVDFDPVVLAECVRLSYAGAPAEGTLARAGTRRGGAIALGSAGNSYINLNLSSPITGLPYNFPAAYLHQRPYTFPLGTERSIVTLTWRAIAYSIDPWNGGTGSLGAVLYNRAAL